MHYSSRIKFSSKEKRERQRGETSESNLLTRINSRHTKSFRVEKLTTNDRVKKKKKKRKYETIIYLSLSLHRLDKSVKKTDDRERKISRFSGKIRRHATI